MKAYFPVSHHAIIFRDHRLTLTDSFSLHIDSWMLLIFMDITVNSQSGGNHLPFQLPADLPELLFDLFSIHYDSILFLL